MSETIYVGNYGQLDAAIATVDNASSGSFVIRFTNNITESTDLYALNLQSGVNVTIYAANGDGANYTLDGSGLYRGLFVYAGDVTIQNLTIQNVLAIGGAGAGYGGGGAGLGGGLFVASDGTVTLDAVDITGNAEGGSGAASGVDGGGGGLGGAGGVYGGGGVGVDATGSNGISGGDDGIILGAAGAGNGGGRLGTPGGSYGGGGGAEGAMAYNPGLGGGVAGSLRGGGFGGGGGGGPLDFGGIDNTGSPGGFGGGGGGGGGDYPYDDYFNAGGSGGFGGGGGGGYNAGGAGGFGAGNGGDGAAAGGGGGLAAGGDIFIQAGGILTIEGGTLGSSMLTGGVGAGDGGAGAAYGSGIFLQGTQTQTFAPASGQTLTITGVIADQNGSIGSTSGGGAGGIIIGSIDANTGTVDLAARNTFTNGVTLDSGVLVLGAPDAAGTGTITFGGGDPPFLDFTIANAPTNTITGLGGSDTIDVTDLMTTATTATVGPEGALAIPYTNDGGGTLDLQFTSGFAGDTFNLSPDGVGGTDITFALCFCKGTLIRTTSGDVPVECLGIGDTVMTWRGETQPITWIGIGKVLATRGCRNAATPVIVRKGALAGNIPNADLRVTKGHSFLVDGLLIPVEYLINHRSILWDDRAQEISIYHVELAVHDILIANGAPAESYRDDGNRWLFQNASSAWGWKSQQPCAPVLTGGAIVDRVWRRLLDRAGRFKLNTTDDPDLHLRMDGKRIDAAMAAGAHFLFHRPEGTQFHDVRIKSRAAAPDVLGSRRDPRRLGVALQSVTVFAGPQHLTIRASDDRLVDGFHCYEPEIDIRWTDGNAVLPDALFNRFDQPVDLLLQLAGSAHYLESDDCFALTA